MVRAGMAVSLLFWTTRRFARYGERDFLLSSLSHEGPALEGLW